jgi:dTDP-4-dehydrorhamnose reductase
MRILVVGKTGQVGRELGRIAWPGNVSIVQLGRSQWDMAESWRASTWVADIQPDLIINAAAYTAVDRAEAEPLIAAAVNRDAPAALAEACEKANAGLIHISTDYVFDGSKHAPYVETDPVAPLSVYGRTKAEGEAAIRDRLRKHVILRTSWVFAAHGSNFVRTMLRLGQQRAELRIVTDQRGAPTAARDIAQAIADIANAVGNGCETWGTYHFASEEPTSWFGFAEAIFALSEMRPRLVPILMDDYKTPARRPRNSVMDCGRIATEYGIAQPSWRRALAETLADLSELRS